MPERAEMRMRVQTFVGDLLTDPGDHETFFTGRRHVLLAKFDLTDEEREALLASEASSLQELAEDLMEVLDIPPVLPE